MRLLAIDSSGLVASVAIVEQDEERGRAVVLAEYMTNFKKTHSQTLLPMIQEMTDLMDLDLASLDAVAVAKGPGSFTGLRIGSATAKGLCLALDRPIIPVPTVDALAFQMYGMSGLICPLMDARRSQVYTGLYRYTNGRFTVVEEQMAVAASAIVEKINAYGEPVCFLGDGVEPNRSVLEENCTVPWEEAPPFASRQRAGALGCLALEYARQGKCEHASVYAPEYLRLSQAERERMERKTMQSAGDSGEK